jgi:hypothetical protein
MQRPEANILNKQSQAADKEVRSSFGIEREANMLHPSTKLHVVTYQKTRT